MFSLVLQCMFCSKFHLHDCFQQNPFCITALNLSLFTGNSVWNYWFRFNNWKIGCTSPIASHLFEFCLHCGFTICSLYDQPLCDWIGRSSPVPPTTPTVNIQQQNPMGGWDWNRPATTSTGTQTMVYTNTLTDNSWHCLQVLNMHSSGSLYSRAPEQQAYLVHSHLNEELCGVT